MSRYVDSYDIESQAISLLNAVEELDSQLVLFQGDLDTNDYMREELDWDYMDVRKTLDKLLHQTKELALDASSAYNNQDAEEN